MKYLDLLFFSCFSIKDRFGHMGQYLVTSLDNRKCFNYYKKGLGYMTDTGLRILCEYDEQEQRNT